ncbi:MAG: hypothetical protein FWF86_04910 [Clostridia bacterium]|nr:hypothetical protein [Clostridia bacterium]
MLKKSLRKGSYTISVASILSFLFLLLAISCVSYYIWMPSRGEFHSDTTDTLMWAQASYDGKTIINPDFEYACFLPLSGYWLMVPFVAIFGVTMTAHLWGMFLFLLLFSSGLLFLLKSIPLPGIYSNIASGLILILLCSSEKTREMFFGHIIYYSQGIFFALWGLGLLIRALRFIKDNPPSRLKAATYCLLIVIWFAISAANQFTIISIFCIPAIGALLCERMFFLAKPSAGEKTAFILVLLSAAVGIVLGYFAGNAIIGDETAGYADSYLNFSPPEAWGEHITLFFSHWATLLGVIITGQSFSSMEGVNALLYLLFAITLLAAPIVLTAQYPKITQRGGRLLIWFHWIATAVILVGFICGDLSYANWRITPLVATSLLMAVYLIFWLFSAFPWRRIAAIPLAVLLAAGCLSFQRVASLPTEKEEYGNSEQYQLVDFLKERDLTYGFASYWRANNITVLSDSAVKTRHVSIDSYGVYPSPYQSNIAWYEAQEGQERYFLLLSEGEYAMLSEYGSDYFGGEHFLGMEEYSGAEEAYYVLIYDVPPFEWYIFW